MIDESRQDRPLQRGEIITITPFNPAEAIDFYTQVLGVQTRENGDKTSTGLSEEDNKIIRRLAEEWLKTGAETRKQLKTQGFLGQNVLGHLAGLQYGYDSDKRTPLQRTRVSENPPKDFDPSLLPKTVQNIDLQALIDTFILYIAQPPYRQDANDPNRLLKLQRTDGYQHVAKKHIKVVPKE